MAKVFRSWDVDQGWLLPPWVHEFVPPGHLAHFVRDTVREALDLSAILDSYAEERGFPPYHPGMMVALLLYGYSRGLYSSRQLAHACEERVDVMAVTGLNRPEFASRPFGSAPSRTSASATSLPFPTSSSRCCVCAGQRAWCSSGTWPWTGPS
jgi:hypothetical protein